MLGRKRRLEDGSKPEPKARRFLTDSRRPLYDMLDEKSCSYRQYCRVLRTHFPEFGQTKRAFDMCNKCHGWDVHIRPLALKSLREWRHSLRDVQEDYWELWDRTWAPKFEKHLQENLHPRWSKHLHVT